jgi:lysozyme
MLMSIFLFIIQFESFSHAGYFDRTQVSNVYGTKRREAKCITEDQAQYEALEAIESHLSAVDKIPALNESQRAALTSFSYNVGETAFRSSKLYKYALNGQKCLASLEFSKWVYQSGRKLNGLVKRRSAERALFAHGLDC